MAIGAAGLALLLAGGYGAGAQPSEPVSFQPDRGERLHKTPSEVRLSFDASLDSSSDLIVFDGCAKKVSGPATVSGREIHATVSGRSSGHYSVRYSITTSGGAPPVGGTYSFHVETGPKCDEHGHDRKGGHAGSQGGGGNRGKLFKADREAFLTERLGPLMSLALVLLVPILAGVAGGFALRRRERPR
jgi:hypothetical protein